MFAQLTKIGAQVIGVMFVVDMVATYVVDTVSRYTI